MVWFPKCSTSRKRGISVLVKHVTVLHHSRNSYCPIHIKISLLTQATILLCVSTVSCLGMSMPQ